MRTAVLLTVNQQIGLLLALLRVNLILECLTSLELGSCASSDLCLSAGAGITACSCSLLYCLESTETYELYLAAVLELIGNNIDESLNSALCSSL